MPKRRELSLRDLADHLSQLPAEVLERELEFLREQGGPEVRVVLPALTTTRLRFEEELRAGRVFAVRRSLTAAAAQFPLAQLIGTNVDARARAVVWRIRATAAGTGNLLLLDNNVVGGTQQQGRSLLALNDPPNAALSRFVTETQSSVALPTGGYGTYLDGVKVVANQEVVFEGPAGAPLYVIEAPAGGLGRGIGVTHSLAATTLDVGFLWSEELVT